MTHSVKDTFHRLTYKVQIFDTDCYGVMWHGAYTKWLEMARVDWCEQQGLVIRLPRAGGENWIFPVREQQLRFRSPARLGDALCITTRVSTKGPLLVFHQVVAQSLEGQLVLDATTQVAVVNAEWQVQRRLPTTVLQALHVKT